MRQQLALLAFLCAVPVLAGEPYLVKDINPDFQSEGSSLDGFVVLGGSAVFAATTAAEGREIWASDGTEAGTFLLADTCPGECSGNPGTTAIPVTSRGLFFAAQDGEETAVWITRGTPASTFRLTEGVTLPRGVWWTAFVEARGLLFFVADGGASGLELWRSDGTPAGTFLVKDIRPGALGSSIQEMWAFAGRVFFTANDGATGASLWTSDGTAAGTSLVKDTWPGNATDTEGPRRLHPASRRLYFFAPGPKGRELWASDGTAKGTRLLVETFPGPGSGDAYLWQAYKGRLLFFATDGRRGNEVWTTDGTPQGTRILRDLCRGSCSPAGVSSLALLGGRLLFYADDGQSGTEIWQTDGMAQGTVRMSDFAEPYAVVGGFPFKSAVVSGKVLFPVQDAVYGEKLWVTDGTRPGTRLLADLNDANRAGSFPRRFMRLGDEVVFTAHDGQHPGLLKSDGTAAGTTLLQAFDTGSDPNVEFGDWEEAGGLLYFQLRLPGDSFPILWRTDGTSAGTFPLSLGEDRWASELRAVGDKLFFVSFADEGRLWASDGTEEGTRPVLNGLSRPPRELTSLNGQLFFVLEDPDGDPSLWKSDGTAAGTLRLREFGWELTHLTVHQGFLYFYSDGAQFPDRALWRSDGTAAGTVKAADIPGFQSIQSPFLTSAGPLLYLWNMTVEGKPGLWVSDGTAAGTRWISPVHLFQGLFTPPVVLDGAVYFFGEKDNQTTLWRSDGTAAGTHPVRDGLVCSGPTAVSGGLLFFVEAATDFPLWQSDGTAAGSAVIRELVPTYYGTGTAGALFAVGPRVFFQAYDPATGYELWAIDTRED
jgi:ELWxxDGT repeat protein